MEGSEQKAGEGKEEACMNEKWQEKTWSEDRCSKEERKEKSTKQEFHCEELAEISATDFTLNQRGKKSQSVEIPGMEKS